MSALARELEEARQRAGDAESEAYALRMTLAASERDAAFWRREARTAEAHCNRAHEVIAAVEAALPGCTGDLARDVAGLVATLREHEIALARATSERDTALDAIDAAWVATGLPQVARETLSLHEVVRDFAAKLDVSAEPAPQPERLQLCTPEAPEPHWRAAEVERAGVASIVAIAASVETATAPHRVGDVWRNAFGADGEVRRLHDVEPIMLSLHVRSATALTVMAWRTLDELREQGWRRIRCAPEAPKAAPTLTGDEVRALLVEGDAVAADLKRRMRGKVAPYEAAAQCAFCGDTMTCRDCRRREAAALVVGDAVRVKLDDRAAVGRIGRSPTDGTLEAWRVEADDGREFYGRDGDIERVAVKP